MDFNLQPNIVTSQLPSQLTGKQGNYLIKSELSALIEMETRKQVARIATLEHFSHLINHISKKAVYRFGKCFCIDSCMHSYV